MKIQEAIEEAAKLGETCIRRPTGIMKVRIICPETEKYGMLMSESFGPVSGMSGVVPYFALSCEDITAINWSVATGVKLEYDGSEPVKDADTIDELITKAAKHVCDMIIDMEPLAADNYAEKVKYLSESVEFLGRAGTWVQRKGENDDNKQETRQ